MKILIDARMYGVEHTGIGRYTQNLITNILKVDNKNKYLILLKEPYFNQLKLPQNAEKIFAPYNHYSIDEQLKLPFLIQSLKPDFVHFLHINVPIIYNQPFIATIHDLIILKQNKEKELLPIHKYVAKKAFFAFVVRHAIKQASYIITPSKHVKDTIIKKFNIKPSKIFPIYEGIEKCNSKTLKHSNHKTLKNYFLYVGNAFPHKNLDKLLEALKIINHSFQKSLKLVIVTKKNKFLDYLKNQINKLKLEKNILIKSQINDSELYFLYKNSIAFVFPSLDEGFGLPGLEALNAGTILCASNIRIFKEIYQNNALYFDPHNAQDIANTMIKATKLSPIQRERIIKKGTNHSQYFNWAKTAKETLNVYQNIYSKLDTR
ncbi:MAG: glycosyltransferase family 4 protein [Patescibacteria group bacterium]|nr:glycosyltransferase family 4 protein [Patescibacteria group bacterium]